VAETYQTGTLNGKPYAFVDSLEMYFIQMVAQDILNHISIKLQAKVLTQFDWL